MQLNGKFVGVAALSISSVLFMKSAVAAPTWQVQADFAGTTTRSLRGIALSPDGSQEYVGFIQGTSGTIAQQANHSSAVLARQQIPRSRIPSPSTVCNPKAWLSTIADSSTPRTTIPRAPRIPRRFSIFSSDLLTTKSITTTATAGPPAYQLGGIDAQKVGGNNYAYVASNKGAATIERWNVNNPAAPVLDTSWASSGILNLKTTQGTSAFVNGLTVASDGTIYATGGVLGTGRGDKVFKISADASTIASANVDQALDVALFGSSLYVVQYRNSTSDVAVLNASDLTQTDTYTTGFARVSTDDTGYSGITVSSDGKLYVSDQIYGATGGTQDRVLVSSPVPEPGALTALAIGAGALLSRRGRKQAARSESL